MKRSTYLLAFFGAFTMLCASVVRGQSRTGVNTWGFVTARYDTRSPASIYTGYGWHGAFAMAGVLHNTRSGYSELLGGVGASFRAGAAGNHWLAVATAQSGRFSCAQIYWLPTVRTGFVTTRAQVKWTVAYKGSAPQKLGISPLSMTMPVWRRMAGGVAVDVSATEGARTSVSAGPELRLRLPRAGIGADALRDVTGTGSRLRLFFASMF